MIKEYKPVVENSENLNKIAYSHISSNEFELIAKQPVLYVKNTQSGIVFLKHKTNNFSINLRFNVNNRELTDLQVCFGSHTVKSRVTVDKQLVNEIKRHLQLSF